MDDRSPRKSSRSLFAGKVRQERSRENWLRLFLLVLMVLWLFVTVVLPVYEVLDRSIYMDVAVTVFGEDDIRVGGRRVFLEDRRLRIDEEPVELRQGQGSRDGVSVVTDGSRIFSITCEAVLLHNELRRISPIRITLKEDRYEVDGQPIPEESGRQEVRRWIGAANFIKYFSNESLYNSLYHSLFVSVTTTLIAVILAFVYAYAVTRTRMPGKVFFRIVALLPLYAPTMLFGLSLVYLFGNKGIVTTGFLERFPSLALDIGLYGPVGIVMAETVFTFPTAFIILTVAMANTDARLYEAALSLGASRLRVFRTVTIPGIKFGLISAVFVCFTLCFTDFGAPKIVGGNYNILAVDIYKQVIGQQNFGMGATISIILLVPALISFIADRLIQGRHVHAMTARSVPFVPKHSRPTDMTLFGACSLIAFFVLALLFTAGLGSLVKMWPYDLSLGFQHYGFADTGGGGYGAFWNSVRMALYTALVGTMVVFLSAYLIDKTRGMALFRQFGYFLSIIPLALPGLVIGIAYIFFFNRPSWPIPFFDRGVPNPLHVLYGTMGILVISNIIHFYTVSFFTATTALRQLDKEFETVSESMSVPFYRTFLRVTVPICLPAILEIAMFFFVSAMATVSAVIFLYSADTKLASVAVVNMDDAGDTAPAAAMCMLIVMTNIVVRVVFEGFTSLFKRKTQSWRLG